MYVKNHYFCLLIRYFVIHSKKLPKTDLYNSFEEFVMIICCGEALIDMVRATVRGLGDVYTPRPGGSPYHTAIAIGKLGVPVKFLGRISNDFFGEILLKKLRKCHEGDELIHRCDQNSTLAFVEQDKAKGPQYVFYAEGTADCSLQPADLPAKLPADTKCIVFGSISMILEPISTAIESFILREGIRKSTDQVDGSPVISFDPNIRSYMIKDRNAYIGKFEKWAAVSTIVKLSVEDFSFIYPKLDPEKALQKIITMGPRLAICTLGPKGALALLRRNDGSVTKVSAPAVDLPVADTIGAGDTFHGAFLAWLEIKGKMSRSALVNLNETELYNALFFANKAASIVCTRTGAEPPGRKEVETLKDPKEKGTAKTKPAASKPAVKKPAAKEPAVKAQPATTKKPTPAKKPAKNK
jgi:fructokinase